MSRTKLENKREFEDIVIKAILMGQMYFYQMLQKSWIRKPRLFIYIKNNGYQASGVGIKLSSGSNAIETAKKS